MNFTQRRPARLVSVLIIHLREVQVLWSQKIGQRKNKITLRLDTYTENLVKIVIAIIENIFDVEKYSLQTLDSEKKDTPSPSSTYMSSCVPFFSSFSLHHANICFLVSFPIATLFVAYSLLLPRTGRWERRVGGGKVWHQRKRRLALHLL